ncbi:hypothetical protein ANCDUO_17694 [Ancylostoma duodenale]|uniref:Integrase catalytic domain-containing protein n=1 Tax=Ancylostoma duodenale TaxID=51022 RepID=A0A0C2G568_9BILA|nr:hypothetical protein ANCDUO_17694 [Ancylostoma duodenale]
MAQAEMEQTSKNPILLVPGHPLTNMIIMYYHVKLFHAGQSHLVSALRERRQQGRFYPYPESPDLPAGRVSRSRPFQNIGLDHFGPILVRSQQSLRRFIARRGTPDLVLSDNAPTFKLGKEFIANDLAKMEHGPLLLQFTVDNDFRWNLITPYSPWKGGFYERLVGSVKACLKKSVQKQCLDIWMFETVGLATPRLCDMRNH